MSQNNWEADKMLDVYIHDYFVKRRLHESAKAFEQEAKVSTDPVAIDAPGGFLFEWWSVFWDIFIARTNEKHSDAAASYNETIVAKAREVQLQQQKSQQQQVQHLMMQRQHQQLPPQRRDGAHLPNGNTSGIPNIDPLMRQNSGASGALAPKMMEDKLNMPLHRDSSDDPVMKQRFGNGMGQFLDPTHPSMSKSVAPGVQSPGQSLHGAPGGIPGNMQQYPNRNQQHLLSAPEIKTEVDPMMNGRAVGTEGSLMGVSGSNQAGNNLPLKGWPLTGIDPLRMPQQKSMVQSAQPYNQHQLQQQFMLSQQNMTSPSAADMEARKMRMFLNNNRNMGPGKDGQLNSVSEVIPNIGSSVQVCCPVLPGTDNNMLMKQQLQNNQTQQQNPHNLLSSQQTQIMNQLHQPDKVVGSGSMMMDGSMSRSFRSNDQASKNQIGRKRKQPVSSSGPANSSGTANTAGPSAGSAPSTPSTHTPGDVMSMPSLAHNGVSSKPTVTMFGSETHTSGPNNLSDLGRFVDDSNLDDNVESFLSHEEGDPRDSMGNVGKGASYTVASPWICIRLEGYRPLKETAHIQASADKVNCCHFSPDGKLLATGGRDKKVFLWSTDTQNPKSSLKEHTHAITDVRFGPSMPRLATSSFDRTVRVWDADNPEYSLRNFTGHSAAVMSLDFHPIKDDLICSCDDNGEIRYWSITNGSCRHVFEFQGGMTQVRFQPRIGKYLAASAENYVSLFDAETYTRVQDLQGHTQKVHSLCWDLNGERLASVSEDLVKVWAFNNNKWQCIHETSRSGNKFYSCVFHPLYTQILIIGCYQSIEVWNLAENKLTMMHAHEGLVASLAATATGTVASASHDRHFKLWK